MADVNPLDLPDWLKVAVALAGLLSVLWAILVSFVRPWSDERWAKAMVRCSDSLQRHLRDVVLAADYRAAANRDRRLDTMDDTVTAMTAAQLTQGKSLERALNELPPLSQSLIQLNVTLGSATRTLEKLEMRVEEQGREVSEVSGMLKAWRVPSDDAPLRPRRKRAQSE